MRCKPMKAAPPPPRARWRRQATYSLRSYDVLEHLVVDVSDVVRLEANRSSSYFVMSCCSARSSEK